MSTGKRLDPISEPCSFFSPRKAAPMIETIWPTGIIPMMLAVPPGNARKPGM